MISTTDLMNLLDSIRAGSHESAAVLVQRFGPRLRVVVRRYLNDDVRGELDSEDAVQDVWRDFFAKCLHQNLFDSTAGFQAFLAGMARLKAPETNRRQLNTQKRCPTRPVSLPRNHPQPGPSAEQEIDSQDEFAHLLESASIALRIALLFLRDGHSMAEAARLSGITTRQFEHFLSTVRQTGYAR